MIDGSSENSFAPEPQKVDPSPHLREGLDFLTVRSLKDAIEEEKESFDESGALYEMNNMAKILEHSHPHIEVFLPKEYVASKNSYITFRIEPEQVPNLEGAWKSKGVLIKKDGKTRETSIYYLSTKPTEVPEDATHAEILRIAQDAGYELTPQGINAIGPQIPSDISDRWKELHPGQTFESYQHQMERDGQEITLGEEILKAYRKSVASFDDRKGPDADHLSGSSVGSKALAYQVIPVR